MSVPQFGDWDQKGPLPDYSMDFSKIRQNRKQNKRDISRASIGNEEDLISSNTAKLNTTNNSAPHHSYGEDTEDHHSPTVSIYTFISLVPFLVLLLLCYFSFVQDCPFYTIIYIKCSTIFFSRQLIQI